MSLQSYIRLYQELLTMVDPNNPYSIEHALGILRQILFMAEQSKMANAETIEYMDAGIYQFEYLAKHHDNFAGKPGDFHGNEAKRQRLMHMLIPHC